jgi:hypothetical protein
LAENYQSGSRNPEELPYGLEASMSPRVGDGPNEVYFEFTAIGASVKVVAIDALTGTEVSVTGPSNAAQADLERLALRKLRARLARDGA